MEPLVNQFVQDTVTVALVAFGAAGSGKSHTLVGGRGRSAGALPRVINAVFEGLAEKSQQAAAGAGGAEQSRTMHHLEATHCELVRGDTHLHTRASKWCCLWSVRGDTHAEWWQCWRCIHTRV